MSRINALSSIGSGFEPLLCAPRGDNDKLLDHLLVIGPRMNIFLMEAGFERIDLSHLSCLV